MISRSTDVRAALKSKQRGMLLNPFRFGVAGPTDPHYASVSLLLHMDGADASTTFTDNSPSPKTATVFGNAQIDTAQFKFGASSALFDGAGDYLQYATNTAFGFGSGNYTVEGWVRQDTTTAIARTLFDNRSASDAGIGIYCNNNAVNEERRLIMGNNSAIIGGGGSTQFTSNTWQHWAVARNGTTVKGFIGGTEVWSITDSRTLASTNAVFIGANYLGTQPHNGHLDDVRITKGIARYTASFSAPTAPFPDA